MGEGSNSKRCPQCRSERLCRDGLRYLAGNCSIQRWLCKDCGFRFSVDSHNGFSVFKRNLESLYVIAGERVLDESADDCPKNSPKAVITLNDKEARQELAQREGSATLSQQKIVEFIWYMKKNGRKESTILGRVKLIKRLSKLGADLYDPESIKRVIAEQKWVDGRKDLACDAYTTFLAMNGGTWQRPTYKPVDKEPFIPQPSEVKQLIAGCSPRMACFLQTLSETAMRPGELWQLCWLDYDNPTRTIKVTPEKGSKSGTYKASKELAQMIEALPRNYGDRIFSKPGMKLDHFSRNFTKQRKRIANKLKNPRLLMISFKTLRHFRGTMEAWRTKDPFHVQQFLRHRNIANTMRYIHLAQVLFKNEQEYVTKVAHNVNEARALFEDGWTYRTGEYDDGGKIFTKPKDTLASEQ
jgi:integrase